MTEKMKNRVFDSFDYSKSIVSYKNLTKSEAFHKKVAESMEKDGKVKDLEIDESVYIWVDR